MGKVWFYGQILDAAEVPMDHAGDVYWYKSKNIKSEPNWDDTDLALHDKYGCCSYLRIVYSYFLNGESKTEAHTGFCAECGKELKKFIPHRINAKSVGDFVFYFGKHKGSKMSDIPQDYLNWCLDNLTDIKMKERIKIYIDGNP